MTKGGKGGILSKLSREGRLRGKKAEKLLKNLLTKLERSGKINRLTTKRGSEMELEN